MEKQPLGISPGFQSFQIQSNDFLVLVEAKPLPVEGEGRVKSRKELYWFARAAMKKYHRLGGSDDRNVFSHSSGGWWSKIRCGQVWFLLRPQSLAYYPGIIGGYSGPKELYIVSR